jgi:hypothetical protein
MVRRSQKTLQVVDVRPHTEKSTKAAWEEQQASQAVSSSSYSDIYKLLFTSIWQITASNQI